jgi:hypothetical protein
MPLFLMQFNVIKGLAMKVLDGQFIHGFPRNVCMGIIVSNELVDVFQRVMFLGNETVEQIEHTSHVDVVGLMLFQLVDDFCIVLRSHRINVYSPIIFIHLHESIDFTLFRTKFIFINNLISFVTEFSNFVELYLILKTSIIIH